MPLLPTLHLHGQWDARSSLGLKNQETQCRASLLWTLPTLLNLVTELDHISPCFLRKFYRDLWVKNFTTHSRSVLVAPRRSLNTLFFSSAGTPV